MAARGAGALAVVLVLAVLAFPNGARAQSLTCNLPANFTDSDTTPLIAFLGVNAACPAAQSAVSIATCGQCVCSSLALFGGALNQTEFVTGLNSSDPGGWGRLTDFINLCLDVESTSFNDVPTSQEGVAACLADTAFQTQTGGIAGISTYCIRNYAPSPPPEGNAPPTPPSVYGAPPPTISGAPPPSVDAIPPGFEESSGEESSGEQSGEEPPSPPPFPPGTVIPPPFPPGFVGYPPSPATPGVYPPPRPPSPGSGAAMLTSPAFLLQVAVALLAVLCSASLL